MHAHTGDTMRTNTELQKMSTADLKKESEAHWQYSRRIDALVKYREDFGTEEEVL